jgi:hypothetical protein
LLATKFEMRAFAEDPNLVQIVLLYKDGLLCTNNLTSLPSGVSHLLQEFSNVFPEEVPAGLPPIHGIEHQIDLIPGVTLPNRPTAPTPRKQRKL